MTVLGISSDALRLLVTLGMTYPSLIPADRDIETWRGGYEEGWDLFDTNGDYGHSVLELERCDTVDDYPECNLPDAVFDTDFTAARVVVARALDGQALHLNAMHTLYWECAQEWRTLVLVHHFDVYDTDELPPAASELIAHGRTLDYA